MDNLRGNPVNTPCCHLPNYVDRENALLASYAMHGAESRGRKHPEPDHPYRAPFQRDRDRMVHCVAFRRLSYKTQVFTGEMGDYHRTRLTHTLEVASVARTIGRVLRLNEDLIEALAQLHDIGHPPFGHAGEAALNECLEGEGGFSHNAQALRIVELLEQRYPDFPGLNLSIEVLQGQEYRVSKTTEGPSPLLEVQVVDAADSASYVTHDADDALEVGLLTLDDLAEVAMWRDAQSRVQERWTSLTDRQLRAAVVHELIDWQVSDLLETSVTRVSLGQVQSLEDVRRGPILVEPSQAMRQQKTELEQFLFHRVYRHPQVVAMRDRVCGRLAEMFDGFVARPEWMPAWYSSLAADQGVARAVGDYLAGMTDRFAEQQYELGAHRGEGRPLA